MRPIDADAALKALRKCQTYLYDARDPELKIELSSAEAAINNLPTIQPEKRTEERMETHACDLISRQALCEYALNQKDKSVTPNDIMRFPSAQPETAKRIVGKSRDGMTLWYQCDMCNEPVDEQDNYCRECGRRLIDG